MESNIDQNNTVILAIDQGTTSTRTLVFDTFGSVLFTSQQEFQQIYPNDGWVEHDPEAIWETTLTTLKEAHTFANQSNFKIAGLGITNQRETTLIWDKRDGKCIYNAIVWQDRRTADVCAELKTRYEESLLQAKTGLLLDPYFSATKAAWILDNCEGARKLADDGHLAFGTIDTFLIYRLTEGANHVTDATNASRTNLFNIHQQSWDRELLELFNVPAEVLPEVKDCSDDFGSISKNILGEEIPIYGVAGDQQAAAIGQCCFETGDIKSTYGTGCFVLLNTGSKPITSKYKLLSTVAYRLDGITNYAMEGSIFVAGAAIQWLRDELKIIDSAEESESLASKLATNNGLYMVPAFTGLGAPHWDPNARGAIFGITRATSRSDFVRAALESVCYQTHDLFDAMAEDGIKPHTLKVDGGMVQNDWMLQFLSDILDIPISRPKVMETTALGVSYLVGLRAGIYKSLDEIKKNWQEESGFTPTMPDKERHKLISEWHSATKQVLTKT